MGGGNSPFEWGLLSVKALLPLGDNSLKVKNLLSLRGFFHKGEKFFLFKNKAAVKMKKLASRMGLLL